MHLLILVWALSWSRNFVLSDKLNEIFVALNWLLRTPTCESYFSRVSIAHTIMVQHCASVCPCVPNLATNWSFVIITVCYGHCCRYQLGWVYLNVQPSFTDHSLYISITEGPVHTFGNSVTIVTRVEKVARNCSGCSGFGRYAALCMAQPPHLQFTSCTSRKDCTPEQIFCDSWIVLYYSLWTISIKIIANSGC